MNGKSHHAETTAKDKILNSENLWDIIPEKTKILTFFNTPNYKYRYKLPPDAFSINFANYPNLDLKDLDKFPDFLANIKEIYIVNIPTLCSLKGLPSELPFLERFKIRNAPLESLEYFPKSLPRIKKLEITRTNIQTFEHLPPELPALEYLDLSNNKLVSFYGFPQKLTSLKELKINGNRFRSWFDYPDLAPFGGRKYPKIQKYDNPIRTLAGIEKYRLRFYVGGEITFRSLNLCPRGMRLLRDWMDIKIKEGLVLKEPTEEFPDYRLVRDPKRYDALAEFYRKTPMELAQQYIENPESLTEGEIERLAWEGGYKERQLLESNFSPENPVLKEISKRLTHKLSSGFSLLK